MADMHIMFGRTYGDKVGARRLYQDAFPGPRIVGRKHFLALIVVLGKKGLLRSRQQNGK
jgi:hypothetical protein